MVAVNEPTSYQLGASRVYTSDRLVGGVNAWTERPFLHCDLLEMRAGPDVDRAILSYETGRFSVREAPLHDNVGGSPVEVAEIVEPLNLNRLYCKIEILSGDKSTVLETWYGFIEGDSRDPAVDELDVETGRQVLTAHGLARLLEQTIIDGAEVQAADQVSEHRIGRGLTFNAHDGGAISERGNRADSSQYPGSVFAFNPNDPDAPDLTWNGTDALLYLLEFFPPSDANGDPVGVWSLLLTTPDGLDWYDFTATTERRSVKSIVDEIIDRRRLVGYRIWAEESGTQLFVYVEVFSFADETIALADSGKTITANPTQISLDSSGERVVTENVITRTIMHGADRIVVEGEYVTTTASFDFEDLGAGWTESQESDYLAGDADGPDEVANAAARSRDELQDVFSRFVAVDDWDQVITKVDDSGEYYVAIDYGQLPDTIEDNEVAGLFSVNSAVIGDWWYTGKRFRRLLLLQDPETEGFRSPFVLFKEPGSSDPPIYRYAEHLSVGEEGAGNDRAFACSLSILDDGLGVRVRCNQAGAQQLIASGHFDDAAATKPEHDPSEEGARAVAYDDMITTASVAWDERCRAEVVINNVTPGAHERIRRIYVPDARLDFLLPGTITDLDESSELVESDGEVLRDDRSRLREIAAAAAEWYGSERNAIQVSYNSVKPIPSVEIGNLVSQADGVSVNTPITGVTYDLSNGRTQIITSFADADFV